VVTPTELIDVVMVGLAGTETEMVMSPEFLGWPKVLRCSGDLPVILG